MFYLGVDLGKLRDHAALAVVERGYGKDLLVRHVARLPLGTPYPQVVERVWQMVQDSRLRGQCSVAVDATGVGQAVVDMFRAAQLGCEMCAVTITGGEREQSKGQVGMTSRYSVPKRDLLAKVQVLLEEGGLKIPRRMAEVGSLLRELKDMRLHRAATGRVRMGAEGAGEHDDLVIALALACWRAAQGRVGLRSSMLPGSWT